MARLNCRFEVSYHHTDRLDGNHLISNRTEVSLDFWPENPAEWAFSRPDFYPRQNQFQDSGFAKERGFGVLEAE